LKKKLKKMKAPGTYGKLVTIYLCIKKTYDHVSVYIYSIGEIVKLVSVVPPRNKIDSVFNQPPKLCAHNARYKMSDSFF